MFLFLSFFLSLLLVLEVAGFKIYLYWTKNNRQTKQTGLNSCKNSFLNMESFFIIFFHSIYVCMFFFLEMCVHVTFLVRKVWPTWTFLLQWEIWTNYSVVMILPWRGSLSNSWIKSVKRIWEYCIENVDIRDDWKKK